MFKQLMFTSAVAAFTAAAVPAQAQSHAAIALAGHNGARARVDSADPGLRLRLDGLGRGRIVVAGYDSAVGRIGFFRADLANVAARSPAAARDVARFQSDRRIGSSALVVGTAVMAAALAQFAGSSSAAHGYGMSSAQLAAFGGGAVMATVGGLRINSAYEQLARALRR